MTGDALTLKGAGASTGVCRIVLQPCRLLTLTSGDLDALYRRDLKAYALLVMNLARQLSRKLRVAETILADTVTSVMDPTDD